MSTTDLTKGSTMRHVTVMSFTTSIGIIAIYVVDLFDIFFISLLGEGELTAAAGFAGTIMFFISAVNIGLSVAAGSLVAQRLGSEDDQGARDVTTNTMMASCAVGIAVPAAMWPFLPDLVGFIGAKDASAEFAVMYLQIVLPSSALSGMSMALVASMRAHGDARWAMYPSLIGAGINLVFDPLLIFGLDMGLAGAATATVLARVATFAVAIYAAVKTFKIVSEPSWASFRRDLHDINRYALPAVLSSVAAPIGLALVTRIVTKYGHDAVAGLVIIGRISPVVFSVVNALGGSVGPIVGQNFGAGKHDRVRQAYFDGIKFLAIYTIVAVVGLTLFRETIADAFGAEGGARTLLLLYCSPFAILNFFNFVLMISGTTLVNIGHPRWSTRINWAKNTVGVALFVGLGSMLFGIYGFAGGLLINAALFAWLSHSLTLRFMAESSKAPEPDADMLDFEDDEAHVAIELRAPIHT